MSFSEDDKERVFVRGAHYMFDHPEIGDMAVLKQTGSNDRYVFVEKDGKAVYTLVQLGTRIGDKFEIVSGLNTGDRVITQGNVGLIDGTEVQVVQ